MNILVKRVLSAYKILLNNKVATSFMMLMGGIMMLVAALNGKGNDTKTLPILITVVGAILTIWTLIKVVRLKRLYDRKKTASHDAKQEVLRALWSQIIETAIYAVVLGIGIFLLVNPEFTDKILNIMVGVFTTLNGVFGVINAYKERSKIDFRWKLMLVLTVLELILGPAFIIGSDSIDITGYIIMGMLTTVAGTIEVISACTIENFKKTLADFKKMFHIVKDDK